MGKRAKAIFIWLENNFIWLFGNRYEPNTSPVWLLKEKNAERNEL